MKFYKKTIRDVPLDDKIVLLRADYNVPLTEKGEISDDYRITQGLPTLHYLLEHNCRVVICAHLGRPEGTFTPELSLEPVARHLGELLGQEVLFSPDCVGDGVTQLVKQLAPGRVVVLENLRFHPGEQANDPDFAQKLASSSNATYFVQDAFGVIYEERASTAAITQFLPSVAGLLVEREFVTITEVIDQPEPPFVAVLGGAKVSDKIGVIQRLIAKADTILISGAMANTFLKYRGITIGKSKHDPEAHETVKEIYRLAQDKVGSETDVDDFLVLPVDAAVGIEAGAGQRRQVVDIKEVHDDEYILDVGPQTIDIFCKELAEAHTAIWNGTLGVAEIPQFAIGSARVALQLATQKGQTTSIIGGGDTADFVLKWDHDKGASFSHVSTGGGTSLALIANERLPGIETLMDA